MVVYQRVGENALKVSEFDAETTYTVALDNTPVAVEGPAIITGTMTAARLVDDQTLEFTGSREGVETGKSVRTLSADGRTLTVTATTAGPNANRSPSVTVYVKQ